jgi:hypothetical protein
MLLDRVSRRVGYPTCWLCTTHLLWCHKVVVCQLMLAVVSSRAVSSIRHPPHPALLLTDMVTDGGKRYRLLRFGETREGVLSGTNLPPIITRTEVWGLRSIR